MKKIKGLLLFGILTLLGIGSSFSQFYDLKDNTGSQLLIPSIKHYSSSPRSRITFTLGDINYYSSGYVDGYNHQLTNIYACYDSNLNVIGFKDSRGFLTFGDISSCSSSNRLLITSSTGTNGIKNFNYLYLRSDTSISPYSERKSGTILRYLYFDFNKYYTYSGYVQDVPDGYIRNNLFLSFAGNYGVVSQSLSDGSFLFTSLFDDSFFISNPSIYSGFILLHFGGYNTEYYNGGGTLLLSLGNESIKFNYYTGFYLNYSDISQVSSSLNGYITYNNSISEGYSKFIQMLTGDSNVILTNGNFPSNQLVFTTYGYTYYSATNLGGGLFTKTGTYNFNFEIDNDVPSFITPSGNGNQSNLNYPVSSLYYYCLGPTYNTPDGRPPIYCFDSSGNFNAERLKNCFSDIIVTGGEIQGGLFCNIDGFIQSVVLTGDGSGVSIVPCTSDSCYSSLIIGQSYINLNPVNVVTTGLVLDMITNLTGWVGRCPFPYVDFGFGATFKVFNYLRSLGYNIDPFIPINCAVAGFHAGRDIIFEGFNLTIFDTPLLNGDTEKHKILFRFFDVLLIFAIFGIFRFFRKHI